MYVGAFCLSMVLVYSYFCYLSSFATISHRESAGCFTLIVLFFLFCVCLFVFFLLFLRCHGGFVYIISDCDFS